MIRWSWALPLQRRAFVVYVGIATGLAGVAVVPIAAVFAVTGDFFSALRVVGVAAVCAVVGFVAWRERHIGLRLREALLVTGLSYPLWSLVGTFAFWPGRRFDLAFFESASGVTTTGLTALSDTTLSYGEHFARSWLQWVGGGGIAVLSVIALGGVAGIHLFATEHSLDEITGNAVQTARTVFAVYAAATVVIVVGLWIAGQPIHHAILYGLTALSTGGFQPDGALSGGARLVLIVGMMAGAVPLVLYRTPKRLVRDPQVRTLGIVLLIAGFLVWLGQGGDLVNAAFSATSALTTTGFSVESTAGLTPVHQVMLVVLMLMGGCAGSTAGGVKLFRLGMLTQALRLSLFRPLLPKEATVAVRYGEAAVEGDVVRKAALYVVVYMGLFLLGAVCLAAAGETVSSAFVGSSSALGTVGLWSGAPLHTLPGWSRVVLIAQMWAGRVELLPLFLLVYPPSWRGRPQDREEGEA